MQQPQNGEAHPTGRIRNADFHRRKTKKKEANKKKRGNPSRRSKCIIKCESSTRICV